MRFAPFFIPAAVGIALSTGVLAQTAPSRDAEALAALRAIIADPYTPVAPVLSGYSFEEAQYLVDGLTRHEMLRLQTAAQDHGARLPSGIVTALRVKASRSRPNRG